MFLKGVWCIIAGIFLLGQTPALAEPNVRVCKNGVIYYYFASREPAQPKQADRHSPKPRGEAWVQVSSPQAKRFPSSVQAPSRAESKVDLVTGSSPDPSGLRQLMLGTSYDWPAINPSEVKENIAAAGRYLIRLLTKLGYYHPPVLATCEAGSRGMDRHKDIPAFQGPLSDPEAWINLLKSAQEPQSELAKGQRGSGGPTESGLLGYSFPVASPFSFRDSWGEWRSGGRAHRAVDIFAMEGTEVYAIASGVIDTLATFPGAGITLLMRGQDGRGYGYMHLQGYAAGIVEGKAVRTGELLGYIGRTGIQESMAHLHFQVYADHRLCKDNLLNPYGFLVQLCHGVGVTDLNQPRLDLNQPRLARTEEPEIREIRGNRIEIYRRPGAAALRTRGGQSKVKDPLILVIKNY
jgi:murein DD-endopeptidase MepM/ murein hydrolase activator NlpD